MKYIQGVIYILTKEIILMSASGKKNIWKVGENFIFGQARIKLGTSERVFISLEDGSLIGLHIIRKLERSYKKDLFTQFTIEGMD